MEPLSPIRARLASFEHAYLLAIRLREATGETQFILRTNDPTQPVRVAQTLPTGPEVLLAQMA